LFIITCCYEKKASGFTFRRAKNQHQISQTTDQELDLSALETDNTQLPTKFLRKVNSNIEKLEKAKSSSELDLEAMEKSDERDIKSMRNTERINVRKFMKNQIRNTQKPISIHSIQTSPTNVMRAYLISKTGLYLKMSSKGELGGTRNNKDNHGKHFTSRFLFSPFTLLFSLFFTLYIIDFFSS